MSLLEILCQLSVLAEYSGRSCDELSVGSAIRGQFNGGLDHLVSLETKLMESLGEIGVVDGHDFGSGIFNIFVHEPATAAFTQAHQVLLNEAIPNEMRSAYRETNAEDYIVLWPSALTEFTVL